MNIYIEKLSRTNGEQVSLFYEKSIIFKPNIASYLAKENSHLLEMGDIIHIGIAKFLVEMNLDVTPIDTEEYLYYKSIPTRERISRWFEGAIN